MWFKLCRLPEDGLKVAVTVLAAANGKLHVDVPAHAPPQPPKLKLVPGVSLSVTTVFCGKLAVQIPVEQLIPAGLLVTVPVPVTDTVNPMGGAVKVAVTLVAEATVTLQVVFPEHAPPQPPKVLFAAGVWLRVTGLFGAKLAEQVLGQLIPAGLLVTVPCPLPIVVTVSPVPR